MISSNSYYKSSFSHSVDSNFYCKISFSFVFYAKIDSNFFKFSSLSYRTCRCWVARGSINWLTDDILRFFKLIKEMRLTLLLLLRLLIFSWLFFLTIVCFSSRSCIFLVKYCLYLYASFQIFLNSAYFTDLFLSSPFKWTSKASFNYFTSSIYNSSCIGIKTSGSGCAKLLCVLLVLFATDKFELLFWFIDNSRF